MHVFVFLAFLYSQLSRSVTSEKNKKRKRKKFLLFLSKKISALTLFISLSLNLQRGGW